MKRKTKKSRRRLKRSRKCPICWKKFIGGNQVTQTVYATGNPDLALSQEAAKANMIAMNNMMNI
jgi:hypothetical protein